MDERQVAARTVICGSRGRAQQKLKNQHIPGLGGKV